MEKKGKIRALPSAKQLTPEMPGASPDLQKAIDKG